MAHLTNAHVLCFLFAAVTVAVDAKTTAESGIQTTQTIVNDILSWQKKHINEDLPFVTITYAQSLDGKIAVVCRQGDEDTSSNFALSCPQSLCMTHALRSIHDAILVGGNTLSVDNPRLNNRLWGKPDENGVTRFTQPRPIVLDTDLKHLKKLGTKLRAQNIIACCSLKAAAAAAVDPTELPGSVELLPCTVSAQTGRIDLRLLLQSLRQKYGIHSVMVEGGASVITEFLAQRELLGSICITVAPKIIGRGLPAIDAERINTVLDEACFASSRFLLLGDDSIFFAKLS